jgi:hypothetical protein
MLGATLIRDQVIQAREPRQKRLLTATWMMKPFHGEQFPLDGIMDRLRCMNRGNANEINTLIFLRKIFKRKVAYLVAAANLGSLKIG